MGSKLPPVPKDNRSDMEQNGLPPIGRAVPDEHAAANPEKVGPQGNIKVNTTNQGYQQDR